MRLIDIGANLTHDSFNRDRDEVICAAFDAGVSPIVITGANVAESQAALSLCVSHRANTLFCTAGVHPHDAKTCGKGTLDALRALCRHKEVVAVGECGLDYNRDFSPRDVQREWFEKQAALAAELDMPLFLHERDAFDDFHAVIAQYPQVRKVVHCFTGSEKELEAYLALDCYIGITGWVCDERRGAHLPPLLNQIPHDRLLLETDAPYLLPRTMRQSGKHWSGGRNEPRNLPHIAHFIADALRKDIEVLAEETFRNSCAFFGLTDMV